MTDVDEWCENEAYYIAVDVPRAKPHRIKLMVKERKAFVYVPGFLERVFRLPHNVNVEACKATYMEESGTLLITLPYE